MPLISLAPELLLLIAENLKPRDLKSFLRANKRLSSLLTPVMRKLATDEKYSAVALYFAAVNGNEKMVRLLLEKGENIKVMRNIILGEVVFAAPMNCSDETVTFVLEQGANLILGGDPTHQDALLKEFWQERDELEGCRSISSLEEEERVMMQGGTPGPIRIVRESCYPEEFPRNRTALQWAIAHAHDTLLKIVLDNGANIECKNEKGRTALSEAANRANETAAILLVAKGAKVDTLDHCRATPLHHAAHGGMDKTVQLLLERGADPAARDKWGATALRLSRHRLEDDTLLREMTEARILENEAEFKIFYAAVKKGDTTTVAESLKRGCDVNGEYIRNVGRVEAALVVAAGQGNVEMVGLLLDNGACPNGGGY